MADFRPLSDTFSVSAQITPDEVQAAADAGFKHIMCNRPDNEDQGQPHFADISDMASKRGLSVHSIPFDGSSLTPEVIDAIEQTLSTLDGPVLAYCRSGTRCSIAWSAVELRKGQDLDTVQATTLAAGYDLTGQRELIKALGC